MKSNFSTSIQLKIRFFHVCVKIPTATLRRKICSTLEDRRGQTLHQQTAFLVFYLKCNIQKRLKQCCGQKYFK